MNRKPYWRSEKIWICPNHLPSVKIPAIINTCWYSNCSSVRPAVSKEMKSKPVVRLSIVSNTLCAWERCDKDNGQKAKRRNNSKYCSVDCKNRRARNTYNLKKKAERKRRKAKAV